MTERTVKATNNFIIRIWSAIHQPKKARTARDQARVESGYSGTITDRKTGEEIKFHTAGELLKAIEYLNKKAEKARRED